MNKSNPINTSIHDSMNDRQRSKKKLLIRIEVVKLQLISYKNLQLRVAKLFGHSVNSL